MSAPDGPALVLEGAPATAPAARSRTGYFKPLAHYVPIFERSERNLKGWIADGRDADPPRLPPFDAPAEMLCWWHAVKSHRPPDVLIRLAAAGGRHTTAPPDPAKLSPLPSAATPAGSTASGPLFESAVKPAAPAIATVPAESAGPATANSSDSTPPGGLAIGFSASLARQRIAEAKAGELHNSLVQQAILATDPEIKLRLQAAAEQAARSWAAFTSEMRRAEAEAPKILAAAGKNWNADDVVAAIHELHVPMRDSVRALARRMRPLLVDLSAPEAEALWDREVEKLFATWRRNKFVGAAFPAPTSSDADGA